MKLLSDVKQKAAGFVEDNAAALLTAGGVVGVIGTGVLSWRGGYKYAKVETSKQAETLANLKASPETADEFENASIDDIGIPKKEMIIETAVDHIPPVLVGTAAIVAIIMSNRVSANKAAALAAAYGLAERNFSEYKDKVEEKLTGSKQQAITDEMAQEAVDRDRGHEKVVIVEGEVLCYDKANGRYFNSTMEQIRQAVNTTNAEIHNHGYARLSFFYTELGLPETDWSDDVGFNGENLLDLDYSTVLAPGNRPCIAISFKRLPRTDFHPNY